MFMQTKKLWIYSEQAMVKPRDNRYALYTHLARTGLGLCVGLALCRMLALLIALHSRASAHGQDCIEAVTDLQAPVHAFACI